jgi:hypothetical protein
MAEGDAEQVVEPSREVNYFMRIIGDNEVSLLLKQST